MISLFHPPNQNVNTMLHELRTTLESRWWGQGPKVDRFEKMFGDMFGFKYCVMTNSGTASLHLAYILAGVETLWEVIVPVLTCTATCHPIKLLGGRIIFADIMKDTLTIDPEDVANKMTPWVKAIVHVHLGGLVAGKGELKKVAKGKPIIEDACQALGAKGVGYGDFTCFSFQAIKALSTGDGGMLVCKKKTDYERAKRLRWFDIDREQKRKNGWQAWDRRGITFDQREVGYKYQPTDIDASLGIAGLKSFRRNLECRQKLVSIYREELKDCPQVTLLKHNGSADWLFMVLVNGNRDYFAERLLKAEIETNVAHIRNDIFTVFGGERQHLPNMNEVESRYICLPLHDRLTESQIRKVCKVIKDG